MLYQFECSVCKSVTIYVSRNPRERLWCCRKVRVPVVYPLQTSGLTPRAVDEGESAPLQAESTPEVLSIEEADTTPALRN